MVLASEDPVQEPRVQAAVATSGGVSLPGLAVLCEGTGTGLSGGASSCAALAPLWADGTPAGDTLRGGSLLEPTISVRSSR